MGVQSKNMFVGKCAPHPQDTSHLTDAKFVCHPPNCKSMLLEQHKMYSRICAQSTTTISHVLDRLTEVCQIENQCFGSNTFHSSNQVTNHAINNCDLFLSVWL